MKSKEGCSSLGYTEKGSYFTHSFVREKRPVEQCCSPCKDRGLADLLRCCAWVVDAGLALRALSHQRRRRAYVYAWDRFSVSFLKAIDSSDFIMSLMVSSFRPLPNVGERLGDSVGELRTLMGLGWLL